MLYKILYTWSAINGPSSGTLHSPIDHDDDEQYDLPDHSPAYIYHHIKRRRRPASGERLVPFVQAGEQGYDDQRPRYT